MQFFLSFFSSSIQCTAVLKKKETKYKVAPKSTESNPTSLKQKNSNGIFHVSYINKRAIKEN